MYKTLLIIGISLLLFSCEKQDSEPTNTAYILQNNTNQSVTLRMYNKETMQEEVYVIDSGKSKYFPNTCDDGGGNGICEWLSAKYLITVKFDVDNKCLVNYPKFGDSRLYDNFSIDMYSKSDNLLLYLIDQEELDAATPCN